MTHNLTAEQVTIVKAATDTKDNLLISALAGAAKTTTLILIAEALPQVDILCLAFNKKIATEMAERLPSNCTSKTLNSIGYGMWAQQLGTRLAMDFKKAYNNLIDELNELPGHEQKEARKNFKELLATVEEARRSGYFNQDLLSPRAKRQRPAPLLSPVDFYAMSEYKLTPHEQGIVDRVVNRCIDQAFKGVIDFADQILMPACFRCMAPLYKLVLIDEAQDLSALDHRLLSKLARYRLIAVGDKCQAIYGFRGADEDSMESLRQQFSMTELSLTVSFRCPEVIVEHVKWRAPAMTAWEGNPTKGQLNLAKSWYISNVPNGAAVICRNNAPLFRMAIAFLRNGRYPKLHKGDIVTALINHMKKLGPSNMARADALVEVRRWKEERLRRSRAAATINDQADCMELFLRETETLGQAITYLVDITEQEGEIHFLTGHKAKGLEFKEVYFLDQELVADKGQDRNLRYVICTRAQKSLTYINTNACVEIIEAEEEEEFPA